MSWRFTPYVWLYITTAIVMLPVVIFLWRKRSRNGALSLLVLCVAVVLYALGNALEISSMTVQAAYLSARVQYPGITTLPVAFLVFAAQYTYRSRWMTVRVLLALAIIPIITTLQFWYPTPTDLVWRNPVLDVSGPFTIVTKQYGAWFPVHFGYSYALSALAAGLLIQGALTAPRLYRGQAIALIIGALVPLGFNLTYVLASTQSAARLDPSGPAFGVSGIMIAWAAFRYRLFDIVPAARDAVIESMSDSVIVLDAMLRIVDVNPAATRLLGRSASELTGQLIADILGEHAQLVAQYRDVNEAHVEVSAPLPGGQRDFEMVISPLTDQTSRVTGRVYLVRDITERKQAERQLAYLSTHDALTGVYNRGYFEAEMARLQHSRRFPVTIVVVDVNTLKATNDRLGHAAGDDLLRRASRALSSAFRAEDMVARIGGDEFAIVLPEAGAPAAQAAVARVRHVVEADNSFNGPPVLSVAVGAAVAEIGEPLDDAFKIADRNMYADKSSQLTGADPGQGS
jgi:diguanylate cyclase (GGDEF)-like protein/PAS domain S-box-containing protein